MEKGTQHSPPLDSTPLVVSRRDVYFVENVAVEPTSCQAERARAATTLFLLFFSWRSGLCQISMLQITPPQKRSHPGDLWNGYDGWVVVRLQSIYVNSLAASMPSVC